MNLLILGGTVFVGRHLTQAALDRGHTVTHFNRGQHNPELFPDVEKLRGDRDGDLSALAGRQLGRGDRYLRLRPPYRQRIRPAFGRCRGPLHLYFQRLGLRLV